MELAERFSNPDFLARIDRLLTELEHHDDSGAEAGSGIGAKTKGGVHAI
jgi:hypothetical protein